MPSNFNPPVQLRATLTPITRLKAILDHGVPIPGPPGEDGKPKKIQWEGVDVVPMQDTLNFMGEGVALHVDFPGQKIDITIPKNAVDSVFGRFGAVVAMPNDYTAAMVTNAVDQTQSYANPAWITSLDWSKVINEPTSFPPAPHAHVTADITSGVFPPARLGSGTANTTTHLRGDGAWAVISASQVTNAVSTLGSYADPAWITSLSYGKLTGVPSSFTPAAHVHAGTDITTGLVAPARLGVGTPSSANYLRGDGSWQVVVGGSGHTIFDEGTPLTPQPGLNFIGDGVSVTNDPANNRTVVAIVGSGTGSSQTPWVTDIDGNGHALTNVGQIGNSSKVAGAESWNAAIVIEGTLGDITGGPAYSPRMSFHWLSDAQIGLDDVGVIRTFNWDGSQYSPFAAALIESKSGGIKFPDGSIQTTAAGGGAQTPWTSDIDAAYHALNNAGQITSSSRVAGAESWNAAIVVDKTLGDTTGAPAYWSRIAFKGTDADAQVGSDRYGTVRTFNYDGTTYMPFAAEMIESTSIGFKFPDGTIQDSAATVSGLTMQPSVPTAADLPVQGSPNDGVIVESTGDLWLWGAPEAASHIAADMEGTHEGIPHGVPSDYEWQTVPFIVMGNNPQGSNALNHWLNVYVDTSNVHPANTRVNLRRSQVWWMRASTGAWSMGVNDDHPECESYDEDFGPGGPYALDQRTEPDGTISVKPISGRNAHGYTPYPRAPIDTNDMGGIVSLIEARLILDNPAGTDDRASSKWMVEAGADYYPEVTGPGIANNPGIGGGRFKYVKNNWTSFAFTTLSEAQLRDNPPPIDLSSVGSWVNASGVPGSGAGVSSVFGRPGPAIVAQSGDYTAALVTNAVSTLGSYANPGWITSLAYSKLTGVPSTFAPSAHVHAGTDITTGLIAVARLGTGTPSASNYLRGDGAWTAVSGGAQTPWTSSIDGNNQYLNNVRGIGIGMLADPGAVHVRTSTAGPQVWLENSNTTRGATTYYQNDLSNYLQVGVGASADAGGSVIQNVAYLQSGAVDIVFAAGGNLERMRISATLGNVRFASYTEVPINKGLTGNLTFDGGAWRYIANGSGYCLQPRNDGVVMLYTAPNGSAGAVATLDGRLTLKDDGSSTFSGNASAQSFTVIGTGGAGTAYTIDHDPPTGKLAFTGEQSGYSGYIFRTRVGGVATDTVTIAPDSILAATNITMYKGTASGLIGGDWAACAVDYRDASGAKGFVCANVYSAGDFQASVFSAGSVNLGYGGAYKEWFGVRGNGYIFAWLGGSLKQLSVDGSGFVKAT